MRKSDFSNTDKIVHNQNSKGDDNNNELSNLTHKLELAMENAHDEYDVEKIREIVEEIKKIQSLEYNFSSEDSLQEFHQTHYKKAILDKYSFDLLADESRSSANTKHTKNNSFKGIKAACIIFVLIFCVNTVTVIIADVSVFHAVIKWTEDVFNKKFNSTEGMIHESIIPVGKIAYDDYESIESQYAVTIFKPYYIPHGYELEYIQGYELDYQTDFYAVYSNGDNIISYNIILVNKNSIDYNLNIEKDSEPVEVYTLMDIDFYIFKNNNWFVASWDHMGVDYNIAGFSTKEEIIKFIDNLKM